MQPTYLPWSGYFNLILKSDHFIFLDDAQYRKNYWHNRNRIILNAEPHWITAPVRKVSLSQSINDTLFDDKQNWRSKHIRLISQNYAKHPFAADLSELFSIIEDKSLVSLGDLSIAIILWACEKLNLNAQIHRASQLGIKGSELIGLFQFSHILMLMNIFPQSVLVNIFHKMNLSNKHLPGSFFKISHLKNILN